MGTFDDRLLALAGRQHYVVSRDQLLDIGTARQIDYRLRTGRIERMYECAYRIAGSPMTCRQRLLGACFAGGKTSVASFRAAAELWHLPGGAELCEVTSPRHRRARHDGVIPHESRHLGDLDVTYVDNIPVTRPARTINDLGLCVVRGDLTMDALEHALLDAARRDLVDVRRVWQEWERLGGDLRPGGELVGELLRRFVPPVRPTASTGETRLLQIVRKAGLPEPVPQFRVWLSPTRWCDLDLAWPRHKLFAEFDPYRWHGDRDRYQRTIARRLELERRGWRGVPVTDDELDAGAPLAIAVLGRILREAS